MEKRGCFQLKVEKKDIPHNNYAKNKSKGEGVYMRKMILCSRGWILFVSRAGMVKENITAL